MKSKDILKCFEEAIAVSFSSREMNKIAKTLADSVRVRAQLGGSVADTGSKKKPFKALSPGYKKQRKEFTGLSDKTTPNKSNVTRTGQMIDSIKGIGKKAGFEILPSGKRSDTQLSNDDVAQYVEEQGRPFLNLSDKEVKELTRLLQESIADEINKCLNRSK